MSIIQAKMPLLARHRGRWTGCTRIVAPDLTLLHQQPFTLSIDFPQDGLGGRTYRQTNVNLTADGSSTSVSYTAVWAAEHGGATAVFEGAIAGAVTEMDEHALYVTFALPHAPEQRGFELITLSADGRTRQRTWHMFNADGSCAVGVVEERRIDQA